MRAVLSGFALILLVGCGRGEQERGGDGRATAVTFFEARRVDLARERDAIGETRAVERATLTSEVAASVEQVLFREGSDVEEGSALLRLDDAEAEAIVEALGSRVERLEFDLTELRDAAAVGAATEAELNDAETTLAEARARLTEAEARLEEYTIRAPFDGRVGLRRVSPGDLLEPGDVVATIVQMDPMEVAFTLPGEDLLLLERGQDVEAVPPSAPERVYRGEVFALANEVDPVSRSISVVARVENGDGVLRPGVFMDVTVRVGTVEDALVVPENAVVVEGTAIYAFVVDEQERARRRDLALGVRVGGFVQVTAGLRAGERVVTSDTGVLRDGTRVEARRDERLDDLGLTLPASRAEEGDPARPGEGDGGAAEGDGA